MARTALPDGRAGDGGAGRPALPRRLDHPRLARQGEEPVRRRRARPLARAVRPPTRGQLRHRERPDRAPALADPARRALGEDRPGRRRPDDRHEQHRPRPPGGDRRGGRHGGRGNPTPPAPIVNPGDGPDAPGHLADAFLAADARPGPSGRGRGQPPDRAARPVAPRGVHRLRIGPARRRRPGPPRPFSGLPAPQPIGLSGLGRGDRALPPGRARRGSRVGTLSGRPPGARRGRSPRPGADPPGS